MLDLYKNIKNRRLELDMSQQTLAEKVGYSGKSMISKVEKGEVDLSTTMIKKFADALNTTSSDLLGWDGAPEFEEEHAEMIQLYSQLTNEQKNTVMVLLRSLVASNHQ